MEKIPAPTMPPTPIETAASMPICADPALTGGTFIAELMVGLADSMARLRPPLYSLAMHLPYPARRSPFHGTFASSAEDCSRESDVAKRSRSEERRVGKEGRSRRAT